LRLFGAERVFNTIWLDNISENDTPEVKNLEAENIEIAKKRDFLFYY